MRSILVPLLVVLLSGNLAGCGLVREDLPQAAAEWPDGIYRGGVEWLFLEMDLSFADDEITGTAKVTRSPIDGLWKADDLEVDLLVDPSARLMGEWTAEWGSGSVGGVMLYPLVGLRLIDGETDMEVGRLRGSILESGLEYQASLERSTDTLQINLVHDGPLPVATVDVTGERRDDVVYLHLGPAYQYSGELTESGIDGIIEFPGVGHYRLQAGWVQ